MDAKAYHSSRPGWAGWGPRWRRWVQASCPRAPFVFFRIAFAATWLFYDATDLFLRGTQRQFWAVPNPAIPFELASAQWLLVLCELLMLVGYWPRQAALAAVLARAYMTTIFPLNDFFYFCVTALLIGVSDCEAGREEAAAWPRDVLILQTAWIYLASSFLKLNAPFLSGGDLFVRQNYLADALGWPYPAFYRAWISTLAGNHALAVSAVIAEASLGLVLVWWWLDPKRRSALRVVAIALAVGIHGFAALALNVYFFGVSLVAQIVCLTIVTPPYGASRPALSAPEARPQG